MPLSHWQEDWDVCLSLPAVLGRDGVISTFPLSLDEKERTFLGDSARSLKRVIEDYDEELYSAELEIQTSSCFWGSLDVFSHYNE